MENSLGSDFLENIIAKGLVSNKDFLILVSSVFEPEYFDDPNVKHVFSFCKKYMDEYKSIPSFDTIISASTDPDEVRDKISEVMSTDFDVSESYQFLIDSTNDYLKEKAMKLAVVDSLDDIEDPERRSIVRDRIENALMKDIKVNLGLQYFHELATRLSRIFNASENRVPTYFPIFDEMINGGFPPYTLNVITAKIHGGKSNTMANFASRQVLNGHNVAIMTLEMSEDAFAQRFDSIFSQMDINKMYISGRDTRSELMKRLREVRRSREEKPEAERGELFIKQYPTGAASVNDFRIYLRELQMRDKNPGIVYVDYINLMKAAYKEEKSSNLYSTVKRVSEELRAMSFEFTCPFVSVSQLNREGFYTNFKEIDFNHIAESMGIPATADFMALLGLDEESMIYESEIYYKILKSRIGGRVNEMNKFFLDKRSLKMYDETEEDLWINDASRSGDSRRPVDHDEIRRQREENTNDRRGRRERR